MSDGSEPIGSIGKALSVLKDLPLWLLTAVTLILLVLPHLPDTSELFQPLVMKWIRFAGVPSGILALFRLGSVIIPFISAWWMRRGRRRARQNQSKRIHEASKYHDIYAPMFAELITIHITTSSSTGAPKFRHRLRNSWDNLCEIKKHSAAIRAAWAALFDRKTSDETGEVDYGGRFPIEKLKRIVHKKLAFADTKLVNLLYAAEEARRESQISANYVTKQDVKLHSYIMTEHDRLKAFLFP